MEDKLEIFDAFFNGLMSHQESSDFELQLDSNTELKKEYEHYFTIKKAAFDIEKAKLRKQLDNIEIKKVNTEMEVEGKRPTTKILRLLKWTSAVAAIFVLGFLGYQSVKTTSPSQLFAQNFEVYTFQQSRGEISSVDLDKEKLKTPEQRLLNATYIMNDARESEAIECLMLIPDESALRNQKYWYLGLANLKNGNISEAKKHFNHLQKISNFKKLEIEDILSEIK